jgi:ribonuclease I
MADSHQSVKRAAVPTTIMPEEKLSRHQNQRHGTCTCE